MQKVIDILILATIKSGEIDEYRNNKGVLLLKAIFGCLRHFWPEAYDACKSGDDFNVPELTGHMDSIQFTARQIDFLSLFCERVAHHLGYYCEDFE